MSALQRASVIGSAAALLFLFIGPERVSAGPLPIEQCNAALIQATYATSEGRFKDYRMAEHVDRGTYDEIKKSAGVSAVIYGVPVGANWDEFKKNISSLKMDTQESLTESEFKNVAWTGLTDINGQAYSNCLKTLVAFASGLTLSLEHATDTEVAVSLKWTAKGQEPNTIKITWDSHGLESSPLPTEATAGAQTLRFRRPKAETFVIVNGLAVGDTSFIVLTALPPPPSPQKQISILSAAWGLAIGKGTTTFNDVTSFVSEACNGKPECSFIADDHHFSPVRDPVTGSLKKVIVVYRCAADGPYRKEKFEGSPYPISCVHPDPLAPPACLNNNSPNVC